MQRAAISCSTRNRARTHAPRPRALTPPDYEERLDDLLCDSSSDDDSDDEAAAPDNSAAGGAGGVDLTDRASGSGSSGGSQGQAPKEKKKKGMSKWGAEKVAQFQEIRCSSAARGSLYDQRVGESRLEGGPFMPAALGAALAPSACCDTPWLRSLLAAGCRSAPTHTAVC